MMQLRNRLCPRTNVFDNNPLAIVVAKYLYQKGSYLSSLLPYYEIFDPVSAVKFQKHKYKSLKINTIFSSLKVRTSQVIQSGGA
jgi:hypothetical protein